MTPIRMYWEYIGKRKKKLTFIKKFRNTNNSYTADLDVFI